MKPFPRFTSKQSAPVPLRFFYVLWRTARWYQQHWKNTLKPGLLPRQRALHTILNLVPLAWEVNGYLWDCRLYKAKHTLTIGAKQNRLSSSPRKYCPWLLWNHIAHLSCFSFCLSANMLWLCVLKNISAFLPCCPAVCSSLANTCKQPYFGWICSKRSCEKRSPQRWPGGESRGDTMRQQEAWAEIWC